MRPRRGVIWREKRVESERLSFPPLSPECCLTGPRLCSSAPPAPRSPPSCTSAAARPTPAPPAPASAARCSPPPPAAACRHRNSHSHQDPPFAPLSPLTDPPLSGRRVSADVTCPLNCPLRVRQMLEQNAWRLFGVVDADTGAAAKHFFLSSLNRSLHRSAQRSNGNRNRNRTKNVRTRRARRGAAARRGPGVGREARCPTRPTTRPAVPAPTLHSPTSCGTSRRRQPLGATLILNKAEEMSELALIGIARFLATGALYSPFSLPQPPLLSGPSQAPG